MEFIDKSQIMQGIEPDTTADILEKGMSHKYFKREGTPGNYKYYYTEYDYKRDKGIPVSLKGELGEIREFEGKFYRKQAEGKWLEVSSSGLTKKEHEELSNKKLDEGRGYAANMNLAAAHYAAEDSQLHRQEMAKLSDTEIDIEKEENKKYSIFGYREHLIDYGTKNGDKDLVEYAKTASDKQIEQRMKSDKNMEQYQDKTSQVNNLKIKENEPGWIVGEGFKIFNTGKDNHLTIKVNDNAGWDTDVHDPRRIKLMDNGKLRGSVYLPKEFKVSDISDKMYELNKETTWGEKQGFTKKDYEEILKMFLYEEILTASSQSKTDSITKEYENWLKQSNPENKTGKDFKLKHLLKQTENKLKQINVGSIEKHLKKLSEDSRIADLESRLAMDCLHLIYTDKEISSWYKDESVKDNHVLTLAKTALNNIIDVKTMIGNIK